MMKPTFCDGCGAGLCDGGQFAVYPTDPMDTSPPTCQDCAADTYKESRNNLTACVPCPENTRTDTVASNMSSDCQCTFIVALSVWLVCRYVS